MPLLPVDYAIRNLGRSPTRLALTVLGSALVVLLVIVAGAFVRGMQRSLRATGGENNVILLGAGSEESVERSEVEPATPGVLAATVPGIRTRADVSFVSPEVHVMLPVQVPDAATTNRQLMLRGITPAATLVHDTVSLVDGRWPIGGADEIVVGAMASTVLGARDDELAVGRRLVIDKRPRTIVGRFASPGTVIEAEAWMPLEDLKAATRRQTISCVVVTLDPYDESTGEGAEFADLAAFTKMRPDLELVVVRERDYYGRLAAFFEPVRIVTWLTAGLIALGGLLGGLNAMYAAFASRIRELGTLQALGFRRGAIGLSMIEESTLATAAGGLLACAVAAFFLDGVAVRFSMGAFGLVVDAPIVGLGLLAGLALGVAGALPPAVRCLRPPIPVALKAV